MSENLLSKKFNRIQLREMLENKIGTIVEPSRLEELENSLGGFDGFTFAQKTGRFEQKITRRDFAKLSGSVLAIITGFPAIIQSCATTGLIKEEGPVHYPKLPGQKIQSPEHYGLEGCMVGYFVGSSMQPSPGWAIKRKEELPGIKALCWWSESWSSYPVKNYDSRIDSSPEALEAFKKGVSDPYFLSKIPYKNH